MKLLDIVPLNRVVGHYGIEVEVEGDSLPHLDNVTWGTHRDGSLRGESAEYVTQGPILFSEVEKAVKSLNAAFKKKESVLNLSFRTSVHVHMNVQEMELDKLVSVVYIYYLFEELLMQYCGQDRVGNRFCLRLRDCDGISDIIRNTFSQNGQGIRKINANNVRYSALNLASLPKFGSLEFRGMRGTVDVGTIKTWVSLLDCIKNSQFNTAKEVFDFLENNGPLKLAENVFGELFNHIFFENAAHEILYNASLAIMIPHTIKFVEKEQVRAADVDDAMRKIEAALKRPAMMILDDLVPARGPHVPDAVDAPVPDEEEEGF